METNSGDFCNAGYIPSLVWLGMMMTVLFVLSENMLFECFGVALFHPLSFFFFFSNLRADSSASMRVLHCRFLPSVLSSLPCELQSILSFLQLHPSCLVLFSCGMIFFCILQLFFGNEF